MTLVLDRPSRPVMRYHGGKWRLAPWILEHSPPHRVYVEPFGGAASVLLQKPRSYAEVYNDKCGRVVNIFRVLRDPASAADLERRLRLTPFARDEFTPINEGAYDAAVDDIDRARIMIFRSFAGFGSNAFALRRSTGFRGTSNRSGTTPAHDWANFADCIPTFIARLRGVVIENREARLLCRPTTGGTRCTMSILPTSIAPDQWPIPTIWHTAAIRSSCRMRSTRSSPAYCTNYQEWSS